MKTKRFENGQGELCGFDFPNYWIGKHGVRELLLRLPGLEIEYLDESWPMDIFCEFSYKGQEFHVSEPYGDNSHYEIVCKIPNTNELEEIYNLFSSASAPTRAQWLGFTKRAAIFLSIVMVVVTLTMTLF